MNSCWQPELMSAKRSASRNKTSALTVNECERFIKAKRFSVIRMRELEYFRARMWTNPRKSKSSSHQADTCRDDGYKGPRNIFSSRSPLRCFGYAKTPIVKWNRADQIVEGMRWNFYRHTGLITPHITRPNYEPVPVSEGLLRTLSAERGCDIASAHDDHPIFMGNIHGWHSHVKSEKEECSGRCSEGSTLRAEAQPAPHEGNRSLEQSPSEGRNERGAKISQTPQAREESSTRDKPETTISMGHTVSSLTSQAYKRSDTDVMINSVNISDDIIPDTPVPPVPIQPQLSRIDGTLKLEPQASNLNIANVDAQEPYREDSEPNVVPMLMQKTCPQPQAHQSSGADELVKRSPGYISSGRKKVHQLKTTQADAMPE